MFGFFGGYALGEVKKKHPKVLARLIFFLIIYAA
ncbi:hypothetical protein BPS26883_00388 [Burkholderia pseudomultivorans]|uniref:Uncharacterized protein n=1 Tax=Burkholderia pseudomultivorans TaxID=1207504 RepID=A0A6P2H629_9BURK|nr:hypothetical protein BPS26883_00388 [Burkholderia pseudomultivorans]